MMWGRDGDEMKNAKEMLNGKGVWMQLYVIGVCLY